MRFFQSAFLRSAEIFMVISLFFSCNRSDDADKALDNVVDQNTFFGKARIMMVKDQIEARGVKDPRVLRAMGEVERHLFVPESHREMAYGDHPLPIGFGQTISQPYIVALMTEILEIEEGERVLEIGTGSGYQAAVLGEIASEVFSIEIVPELGEQARKLLHLMGYENIQVKIGDGYAGWPDRGPFDGIIVTCSPSHIPEPLVDQLAEGGRMVIPVGRSGYQQLVLLQKIAGEMQEKAIIPVRFVPMVDGDRREY